MKLFYFLFVFLLAACGGGSDQPINIASAQTASACVQNGNPSPPTLAQGNLYSSTTEMLTCLPMTEGLPYNWQSVYAVTIPNLRPTDVVECIGQMEVTNNLGYNVQVDRAIGLGIANGASIPPVNPVMAQDFDTRVHHLDVNTAMLDTGRTGSVTYSLYTLAASTDYRAGDQIIVEQGYGGLWCHVMNS